MDNELPKKQEVIRNPDGTFPPGVSGNPNGRPPGKTLKDFAREFLSNMTDEAKLEYLEKLPREIVWKMAEGNPAQDLTSAGEKIIPQTLMVKFIKDESDRDSNRISETV